MLLFSCIHIFYSDNLGYVRRGRVVFLAYGECILDVSNRAVNLDNQSIFFSPGVIVRG